MERRMPLARLLMNDFLSCLLAKNSLSRANAYSF
jgi:hypothetical protein